MAGRDVRPTALGATVLLERIAFVLPAGQLSCNQRVPAEPLPCPDSAVGFSGARENRDGPSNYHRGESAQPRRP